MIDLQNLLRQYSIAASAPARIDCGATWDIKTLALAGETLYPATVNIAIDLRTTVQLYPYKRGRLLVRSKGFVTEEASFYSLPLNTPLRLVFAIASHFGISGVRIDITSDIPIRSGLGGSGVLAVAVTGAFGKALEILGYLPPISSQRLALLAYNIEDGMQISLTGLQDQLAAVYGGVHKWIWKYSRLERPYIRQKLLVPNYYDELQNRIIVAYTGEARNSSQATAKYIESFLDGRDRQKWIMVKHLVDQFADALRNREWLNAARILKREACIRDSILSEGLSPLANELRAIADRNNCGSAFTGGNRGGCIWAIGREASIAKTRGQWEKVLQQLYFPVFLRPISIYSVPTGCYLLHKACMIWQRFEPCNVDVTLEATAN